MYKIISCFLFALILTTSGYTSNFLTDDVSVKRFLSRQTAVKNQYGDIFNLSKESAKDALESSNLSIKYGLPDYLRSSNLVKDIEPAELASKVKAVASRLADYLSAGKQLESLNPNTFLKKGESISNLRWILSSIINNFCFKDGVTTEVVSSEIASIYVVRQRLIDFKKSL